MARASNSAADSGSSPARLQGAILRGDFQAVKELIGQGVPLNQPLGSDGLPPLHCAIKYDKGAIAVLLIRSGTDVNLSATDRRRTALMMAADAGMADVFQALIAAGAEVHAADSNGWTALDAAACFRGSAAGPMVEAAIQAGGDVHRASKTWGTPLIKACWRGHVSASRVLAAHGANVNETTANGLPLMQAINNKRADVIAALLAAGADPHLRYAWPETLGGNKEFVGKTPLELARERKLKTIIPLLEDPGAAQAAEGRPPRPGVAVLWQKLEKALARAAADRKRSLAGPAAAGRLAALAGATGVTLPEEFQASYRIHDGQREGAEGLYTPDNSQDEPYRLLSLEEIEGEWKVWKRLLDGGEFRGRKGTSDDGIRADWWHPGWLPFMSDGGGDSVCLDLAPTGKGVIGQVIVVHHDSAWRALVARSFADFLGVLIVQWEGEAKE